MIRSHLILLTALLCSALLESCGGRHPGGTSPSEAEEARLRELFPNAPHIITRQEQLDSLLELADARIVAQPSPEAYLSRLSLYSAGQQWEKELQDAQAGLALLPLSDTSQLAITLHFARASALAKLNQPADAAAEYRWIIANADSLSAAEARVRLANGAEAEAYRDSVSMLTGIAYGSPYWYDPSWDITYSPGGDTLRYYPREREAAYFTIPSSVRMIEERAFQCNRNLKEIIIPEGVEEIGAGAFLWSQELQVVTIRGRVKDLPWRVFDGCAELRSIELPWSVKSIAGMAFSDCKKLRRIVLRNPVPPELEGVVAMENGSLDPLWAFEGVDTERCVLHVPYGAVPLYRKAPGWDRFRHIEGNIKPIPHRWMELDSTLLAGYGISPEDVEAWKRYFNREFEFDEWYACHIKDFHDEDRYVAITDLQNLWFSWFEHQDDTIEKVPCTLWRMLQYASRCRHRIPESMAGQARLMKTQIDSVLSYTALCNADLGNKNALREYLHRWYYDLLSYQMELAVSPELAGLLRQEDKAWEEYHERAMDNYETVSDSSGSGFHVWYYGFAEKDLELRRTGVERFYSVVIRGERSSLRLGPETSDETVNRVCEQQRSVLPHRSSDDEWIGLGTLKEVRSSWDTEQQYWWRWMEARAAVSDALTGLEKEAWDNATNSIRRQKVKLLKNAYKAY